jgi:hypothetical protein
MVRLRPHCAQSYLAFRYFGVERTWYLLKVIPETRREKNYIHAFMNPNIRMIKIKIINTDIQTNNFRIYIEEISKGYFRSFKSKDRKHDGQKKKVYEQNVHINLDMLQYKQLKYTFLYLTSLSQIICNLLRKFLSFCSTTFS